MYMAFTSITPHDFNVEPHAWGHRSPYSEHKHFIYPAALMLVQRKKAYLRGSSDGCYLKMACIKISFNGGWGCQLNKSPSQQGQIFQNHLGF